MFDQKNYNFSPSFAMTICFQRQDSLRSHGFPISDNGKQKLESTIIVEAPIPERDPIRNPHGI